MKSRNRGAIDLAIPNMFSNTEYASTYLFYAHMIGMCSIIIEDKLPAPAGVSFMHDHYNLYINPNEFDVMPLVSQLAVLKHEMEHILNNHIHRVEDRNQLPWNYATDCAINQFITKDHLPKVTKENVNKYNELKSNGKVDLTKPAPTVGDVNAILPETFPVKVGKDWTSEEYYDALKKLTDEQGESGCSQCDGTGTQEETDENGETQEHSCDACSGTGKDSQNGDFKEGSGKLMDDHSTWNRSEGDKGLQKQLTKQMIDRAISETNKAKGNLPQNIEHYVKIFSNKSQISWRNVLKNIVGNKRVNSRRTIMRTDRRFPKREDLRGRTKDRMFDLTVIVDVSGSMSDKEIMTGLNEIHHICKLTKTTMKLIQVDTVVHNVEEFTEHTKLFNRSGCGGTHMEPAIDYIREHKIPTDACVLITDGYIENVSQWKIPPKYKVMFLCTTEGQAIPGVQDVGKYSQFDLKLT